MPKIKRRELALVLGVLGLVLLGSAAIIIHRKSSPAPYHLAAYNFNDQQADLQKFEKEIQTLGGERAYNRLYDAVSNLSADDQHEYGHLFGDALYKEEGLNGIGVCDSRFSYGCFHQMLSDALITYGTSAVPMLDQKCKQILKGAYLSCQHGLGHGIMVTIGLNKQGYDEAHLKQALAYCAQLPDDQPLGGCDGGVYMEYNLHTVANVELEQNDIRRIEQGNMYLPCNDLELAQQTACYFWMPQWWALAGALRYNTTQSLSDNQLYKSTGSLCQSLASASRRTCFEGIGYAAISTAKLDPARTLGLCNAASSNELNNLYCRAFAASMIASVTGSGPDALAVCHGLTGNGKTFCAQYANQQGNFFTSLPDPVL